MKQLADYVLKNAPAGLGPYTLNLGAEMQGWKLRVRLSELKTAGTSMQFSTSSFILARCSGLGALSRVLS